MKLYIGKKYALADNIKLSKRNFLYATLIARSFSAAFSFPEFFWDHKTKSPIYFASKKEMRKRGMDYLNWGFTFIFLTVVGFDKLSKENFAGYLQDYERDVSCGTIAGRAVTCSHRTKDLS